MLTVPDVGYIPLPETYWTPGCESLDHPAALHSAATVLRNDINMEDSSTWKTENFLCEYCFGCRYPQVDPLQKQFDKLAQQLAK